MAGRTSLYRGGRRPGGLCGSPRHHQNQAHQHDQPQCQRFHLDSPPQSDVRLSSRNFNQSRTATKAITATERPSPRRRKTSSARAASPAARARPAAMIPTAVTLRTSGGFAVCVTARARINCEVASSRSSRASVTSIPALEARFSTPSARVIAPFTASRDPLISTAAVRPSVPAGWHCRHTDPFSRPSITSVGKAMLCVPWQTVHSAIPSVSNAFLCGLRTKRSLVALWHCAQTLATEATPGGAAPWLPWQSLHAGAWRFPRRSSPWPWTLSRYSAYCVVGIPYDFIRAASAWQRAHVAGTLAANTGERESLMALTGCTPWQEVQVATLRSPLTSRLPCSLVR